MSDPGPSETGVPVEVSSTFTAVITSMGSLRTSAFERLRQLPALQPYRDRLDALAKSDEESTDFEVRFRELQSQIFDDLSRGS